ncbi:hypothetical protein MCERE10_02558 [Burkholderiaceae bacterium]
MVVDQQTAKNIKRFNRLRVSFWILCLFWGSFFVAPTYFPNAAPLLFLVGFVAGWTYVITLGQLVSQANKSIFLWVAGAILFPIVGPIVSYIRMRGIAIGKGWF